MGRYIGGVVAAAVGVEAGAGQGRAGQGRYGIVTGGGKNEGKTARFKVERHNE